MTKLYQALASRIAARENCATSGNDEWRIKHTDKIRELVDQHLPAGSGFDRGTELEIALSTPEKLVFCTDFHHMNDAGYYDGWTEYQVIVKPSLLFGFTLRVTGRDRNGIKEYILDTFNAALSQEVAA